MNVLETIVAKRQSEVAKKKEQITFKGLEASRFFTTPVVSMRKYLLREDKTGVIAEFKRQSPSKGPLNPYASLEMVTIGYMQAGASALSILTESAHFLGKDSDLTEARQLHFCPILRKDFIFDEWQVMETKSLGADAILLIAAILTPSQTRKLARLSKEIGLEVLLEVHDSNELADHYHEDIDLVGVNNRDLKTFETRIDTSLELADRIPDTVVKISESGLDAPQQLAELYRAGYRGFLMGEKFMRSSHPEEVASRFLSDWMQTRSALGR